MFEIIFNGKGNLTDFGAYLSEFNPQPPAPKIIKDDVPFMNGTYDFSTVGSNGEVVYGERKIQCSIDFFSNNKGFLFVQYSKLLEWLLSGKHELIYTGESDMKYMARVEDVASFDEFVTNNGSLSFTFIADPFKQGVDLEGDKLWDTFNFETDILQDTEFDVIGTKTVTITNIGRPVMPTINVNVDMSLIFNSKTYNLVAGDNTFYDFKFANGDNSIVINGNGHIKFIFRKETL